MDEMEKGLEDQLELPTKFKLSSTDPELQPLFNF